MMPRKSATAPLTIPLLLVLGSFGFSGCSSPADQISKKQTAAVAELGEKIDIWNQQKNDKLAAANSALVSESKRLEKALETGDWAGMKSYLDAATVSQLEGEGAIQAWQGTGDVTVSYSPIDADDLAVPSLEPALTESEWSPDRGENSPGTYSEYAEQYQPRFEVEASPNPQTAAEFDPEPWEWPQAVAVTLSSTDGNVSGQLEFKASNGGWTLDSTDLLSEPSWVDVSGLDRYFAIGKRKISLVYGGGSDGRRSRLLPGNYALTLLKANLPSKYVTVPNSINPFVGAPNFEATAALTKKATDHVGAALKAAVSASSSSLSASYLVNGMKVSFWNLPDRSRKLAAWEPDEVSCGFDADEAGNLIATVKIADEDATYVARITGRSQSDAGRKEEWRTQSAEVLLRIDVDKGKVSLVSRGTYVKSAIRWVGEVSA